MSPLSLVLHVAAHASGNPLLQLASLYHHAHTVRTAKAAKPPAAKVAPARAHKPVKHVRAPLHAVRK